MFPYIAATPEDEEVMLKRLGVDSIDDLFKDIPEEVRLNRSLNLKDSMSEIEVSRHMNFLGEKNYDLDNLVSFLGAGAYDHYVPSVVKHLSSRSEFYTSYTPYQPEISQGTLQAIFEYQTMISNLTGMDVSNASMYDGASACAEAAMLAAESTKRRRIIVSKTVHPEIRNVLKTYARFRELELVEIDELEGSTDIEKLTSAVNDKTAAVIIQNPNFFGIVEDVKEVEKAAHQNKALFIMSVDPISLGVLKSPGELGADIAVGEGQSLGNSLSFGGPYLGFMAVSSKLMRKIPGRIVGQTEDKEGKRAFVLTLQAREQHIRRQKATSNICSNQSLNALNAAIYLTTLGKKGIREVANQCLQKSHYALDRLLETGKFTKTFNKPFFKEFAVTGKVEPNRLNAELLGNGIMGGYDLSRDYPKYENSMLLCVTEKRSKEEIDDLVNVMEGIE